MTRDVLTAVAREAASCTLCPLYRNATQTVFGEGPPDAALMLEVMAGPHPLDYTTLEAGPASYHARLHEGIKGKRMAFSPDLGLARVGAGLTFLRARHVERERVSYAQHFEAVSRWSDARTRTLTSFFCEFMFSYFNFIFYYL